MYWPWGSSGAYPSITVKVTYSPEAACVSFFSASAPPSAFVSPVFAFSALVSAVPDDEPAHPVTRDAAIATESIADKNLFFMSVPPFHCYESLIITGR